MDTTFFKPGDLIFINTSGTDHSQAIGQVYTGWEGFPVTHVALVLDEESIIEALPPAVRTLGLQEFLAACRDCGTILRGRSRKPLPELEVALSWVRRQEGKPYNHSFIPGEGEWYCSELTAEFFRKAGAPDVLPRSPLNFYTPGTQEIMPYWRDYYKNLNREVPQGSPGSHPAAQSRSEWLEVQKVTESERP